MKRIGLIGGLSWESTVLYYTLLNRLTAERHGAWHQPLVVVDSLDFARVVTLQQSGDWVEATKVVVDSAKRLELAGATVLAICANTMHVSFDDVVRSVSIPVVDIRDALVEAVSDLGGTSLALLGTKYVMGASFYVAAIERRGVKVVIPEADEIDELHSIIYDELTQGRVVETSRARFFEIAQHCRDRGGDVVGLCCTELGLYVGADGAPWPYVDSTAAHVEALLRF